MLYLQLAAGPPLARHSQTLVSPCQSQALCLMRSCAATRGQQCLAGARFRYVFRPASRQSKGPHSEMVGLYYTIKKQMCWLSYSSLSS